MALEGRSTTRGLGREQGRRRARAPRQRPAHPRATAVEGARSGGRASRAVDVRRAGARPAAGRLPRPSRRGPRYTSAAVNVAALIEVVAAEPSTRILNSADPDAPSALELSRERSPAISDTSATRFCWAKTPTRVSASTPGTSGRLSSSTSTPRPHSATCPTATTQPPSPTSSTGSSPRPAETASRGRSRRRTTRIFAPLLDYTARAS